MFLALKPGLYYHELVCEAIYFYYVFTKYTYKIKTR